MVDVYQVPDVNQVLSGAVITTAGIGDSLAKDGQVILVDSMGQGMTIIDKPDKPISPVVPKAVVIPAGPFAGQTPPPIRLAPGKRLDGNTISVE